MPKKQKLELTWIGKNQRPKLEPRILIEDPEKSYHAKERVGENDIFDNMLIHGDNLLALKALEQEYAGKVKCVFIDPPYNTGSAFEQYDDGLEHSIWLNLMRSRIDIFHKLLDKNGSLWITIDDNECHYLKVLIDEIFGRSNFVATCVWEKDKGGRGDADVSLSHDNILVYAKDRKTWATSRNLMPRTETQLKRFKNPDDDPRGLWRQGDDGTAKSGTEKQRFEVTLPSGRVVTPPKGRYWAFAKATLEKARSEGRAYFGADGNRLPIIKRYITEVRGGVAPRTWWTADEVGTNQGAKRDHLRKLLPDIEPFATPKPEGLLERILHIATNPGDIVLDSFLGSGTTAAVAHKMRRRWIGVELGDHCFTHCVPRLKKVIDGEDLGGVTFSSKRAPEVKLCKKCKDDLCEECSEKFTPKEKPKQVWFGGGGFRYYELGPSLIEEDKWGNPIISKEFDPPKLTQAMCKLEGFDYAPDTDTYWMQGRSSETDFIYVTSQTMSKAALSKLSDEVGDNRSLLVCCPSFRAKEGDFPNLTLKKIPKAVLKKCEWGRDDYSLQIQELPAAPTVNAEAEAAAPKKPRRKFGKANDKKQQELF